MFWTSRKNIFTRRTPCGELGPNLQSRVQQPLLTEASHAHCTAEKSQTEVPRLLHCSWMLSQTLIKESLELFFDQWAEIYPIQLELRSYSLFASSSTNQSGSIRASQDAQFWLTRTVLCGPIKLQIWFPHLHKNGPIRTRMVILSISLLVSTRGCYGLQTVHLNEVSPFTAPQIGESCWH